MDPPAKDSPPTAENIKNLEIWLNSIVMGHPGAINTYTFYEEIDKYLGPWGINGYPIGYGKKYNILFSQNAKLKSNPTTASWVWKTGVLLQEYLRDYILNKYKNGELKRLIEADMIENELREAAFKSHPIAYTKGGLTMVILIDPAITRKIASIPALEFVPFSGTSIASWAQAVHTAAIVTPEAAGLMLYHAAVPRVVKLQHVKPRAFDPAEEQFVVIKLLKIKNNILNKRVDEINSLEKITTSLYNTEFKEEYHRILAKQVIHIANHRKQVIAAEFRKDLIKNPGLREIYNTFYPTWKNW